VTRVAQVMTRLAISPSNPSVAYGGDGLGVMKSTDGGGAWTRILASNGSAVAIDPTNADIAYFGTSDGQVMKTTNAARAGRQWSCRQPQARIAALAVDPLAPGTVVAGVRITDCSRARTAARRGRRASAYRCPIRIGSHFDPLDGGRALCRGAIRYRKDDRRGHDVALAGDSRRACYDGAWHRRARRNRVRRRRCADGRICLPRSTRLPAAITRSSTARISAGSFSDGAVGIAIDRGGNAYVAMNTGSADLVNTSGQPQKATAIVKLNADASAILYSTFVWSDAVLPGRKRDRRRRLDSGVGRRRV